MRAFFQSFFAGLAFAVKLALFFAPVPTQAMIIEPIGRLGFQRHTQNDRLTYYYLKSQQITDPLLVYIQGSGCDSLFTKVENGYISNLGIFASLKDKVALFGVEKPGVESLDETKGGDVSACREKFRKQFTFDTWASHLKLAVLDLLKRYKLQPSRIIVLGHSEGSDMAALLGQALPRVTHVVYMSGGSGSPLFHAVSRAMLKTEAKEQNEVMASQLKVWADAVKAKNPDALLWGHTFRYWRSQLRNPIHRALSRMKAKVLIVYGTQDADSPTVTSDLLLAELTEAGKEFEFRRVPGDHSYQFNGQDHYNEVVLSAADWALK